MASISSGQGFACSCPNSPSFSEGTITRHLRKDGMEVVAKVPSSKELVQVVGSERPDTRRPRHRDRTQGRRAGRDPSRPQGQPDHEGRAHDPGPGNRKEKALGADGLVRAGANGAALSALIVNLCGGPTVVLPESEVVSAEAQAQASVDAGSATRGRRGGHAAAAALGHPAAGPRALGSLILVAR